MKLFYTGVLLFLITASAIAQLTPISPTVGIRDKTPELTAIINAHIIISPNTEYDTAVMVIDKGHIVDIGPDIKVPVEARIVDLKGYTVYPGFIDPFTEYGVQKNESTSNRSNDRLKFEGQRVGGNAWNDAIHSEADWVSAFRPDAKASKQWFGQGFTAVQSCRLDGIFRGRAFIALLGEGLPNDLILRPYSHHFASFHKGTSEQEYPSSHMGSIALFRQTLLDVNWYEKAHAAYKLNPNQKMPEFNRSIEALAGIFKDTLVFDTENDLSLLRANRFSDEYNIIPLLIGSGYEYRRIKEIAATNASLIIPVDYPKKPEIKTQYDELGVSLATLRHWETAPSNAASLEKQSINFSFTSSKLKDKKNFLVNIRKAIERGLSRQTALAALTTIPASMCGVSDRIGTLEKGKLANFFVSDGNIFDDGTEIYSAWVAGQKNELKSIPSVDFRGTYALDFAGSEYELNIKGTITKPEGELKAGEKTYELKDMSISLERLYFSANLDTNNISGVVRFSARQINTGLRGYGTLPDGTEFDWNARLTSPYSPDAENQDTDSEINIDENETGEDEPEQKAIADEESKTDKAPEELLARLTYPNRSYGVEKLPVPENVLIKNATVWTSDNAGILEEVDVLVENGKFKTIGSDLIAPDGTRIIDGTGKHVTPGIVDEHSHICIHGDVNECTEAITAEVRIGDVIDPDDVSIYRQLAGGVTTSHLLHGSCNPIGGLLQLIKLKWGANAEELKYENARQGIKFALGENVKRSGWENKHRVRYPQSRMGVEAIIRDEFQAAREYDAAWERYNSLGGNQKKKTIPPRHDLELDAVLGILNSEVFVHCHAYVQSEMLMLMRLAEEYGFTIATLEHVTEGYKVAPEMAKHGVGAGSIPDWWAYKFEVYDAIPHNAAMCALQGVVTSINSDNGDMARRLHTEVAKAIKYGGLSEEEALKLCTINPAIQLGVDKWIGSITVGKDADFVIWNGNPLSLYSKAEQTWIEGAKYFDFDKEVEIGRQLNNEKNALIQKIIGE